MSDLASRLDNFLARLEQWLPPQLTESDWEQAVAFRWRKRQSLFGNIGYLQAIRQLPPIHLDDLKNIERQKDAIVANTRQFVQRLPANNVLLTGARGTGKSSLIKACLNAFVKDGLRLGEVDKDDQSTRTTWATSAISSSSCRGVPSASPSSATICRSRRASRATSR